MWWASFLLYVQSSSSTPMFECTSHGCWFSRISGFYCRFRYKLAKTYAMSYFHAGTTNVQEKSLTSHQVAKYVCFTPRRHEQPESGQQRQQQLAVDIVIVWFHRVDMHQPTNLWCVHKGPPDMIRTKAPRFRQGTGSTMPNPHRAWPY